MTHRERFHATIERKPVDRPASWLGIPTPDALGDLFAYFNVSSLDGLKRKLNDDLYPVEVPYHHPPSNHIACAFDFAKASSEDYTERTLTSPGFFEDIDDPSRINEFPWPSPREHMREEECRKAIAEVPEDYAVLGVMWSAHFQDACAAFGMENALMMMMESPEMFQAVLDRILEFYIEANEIFYRAADGRLDAVLIGNDFGSQNALMVSAGQLKRHVFPGTRKLIEQAHSFGLKVIHHSCGAICPIVQDLVDLGSDAIHPIQALAADMNAEHLKMVFTDKASFCGGVDAQNLLVHGTPDAVRQRVRELRTLFPTGLVISPSHEAILPDIPPANIEALFEAATGKSIM
ncbi:MAG: uroporphyrinogen decarboxylase family protein [Terrimicrobiaceae bacterium]